jgi:DNA invertase Pin-like site-specific DNA recombinase
MSQFICDRTFGNLLKSIQENIDTTTSGGKLVFHIFGALAEFERDIIRERTNAGLQAARARGRKGGRPKSLTGKKAAHARELYNNKQLHKRYLQDTQYLTDYDLPLPVTQVTLPHRRVFETAQTWW